MRDLYFLGPILLGVVIMVLGTKLLKPNENFKGGTTFAVSLIVGSLCWAMGSAMNFVWDRSFYIAFDILTICAFFIGCLCLVPRRTKSDKGIWWLDPAVVVIACAFLLGVAHCFGLAFSRNYRESLVAFYHSLGITATKPKPEPAPTGPQLRPVPKPSPFPKNLNPTPPPPR